MMIQKAERFDLKAILELQMLAYRSEAELLGNFRIPPLMETPDELEQEYEGGPILKAVDECGAIVGSVRGFAKGGTFYVGKLMVHPDFRKHGLGTELLESIEALVGEERLELFTSDRSVDNIRLYERAGYRKFAEKQVSPELRFVYMEKYRAVN